MKVILHNFTRLLRSIFIDKKRDIDLFDIPGHLEHEREKAIFATFFFFTVLIFYNAFFRPYLPAIITGFNIVMFLANLCGIFIILSGRVRLGVLTTIYSTMFINTILQFILIFKGAHDPGFRTPIAAGFFMAMFALYTMLVAAYFLDKKHIVILGTSGIVFLSLSAMIVMKRAYFDLILVMIAYLLAGMILMRYFTTLFESIVTRFIGLTGNLKREVDDRTRHLQESEARFRALFENARDAILVSDPESRRFHYANQCAAYMLGRPIEDILRLRVDDIHPPDQIGEILANFEQQARGLEICNLNVPVLKSDGSIIYSDIAISHVTFDGKTFLLGAFRDVTERKRIMEELRTAKEKAEAANRAKNIFLANVSHDLRTPLNSVIGFSGMLKRNAADDRTKHMLDLIHSSGLDLLHLIDDLLDISSIEVGMIKLNIAPASVREIVSRVIRNFSFTSMRNGIALSGIIDERMPETLLFDSNRVHRILSNLVGNAVKYTDRGSVEIKSEIVDSSGSRTLKFTVSDTGQGIAAGEMDRIFDLFYRGDSGSSNRGGAGIGLALVKQLVEAMNGEIHVESKVGKGSQFVVKIPVSVSDELQTAMSRELIEPPKLRGRCLIIDDNGHNRLLLSEALKITGLDVDEAENGISGAMMAVQGGYSIILLDILLPDISGHEVLTRIRSDEAFRGLPVIAVTASAKLDSGADFIRSGFDAFLSKPVNLDLLYSELNRLLSPEAEPTSAELAELIRPETGGLSPNDISSLKLKISEVEDTGGLNQTEELADMIISLGKAAELSGLTKFGIDLKDAASECRVARIGIYMNALKELTL